MSGMILRAGAILVIAGVAVMLGYPVYYVFKFLYTETFISSSVPLPIRIAIPAVILGIILLFVAVGWDRYRKSKKERFEEVGNDHSDN